MSEYTKLNTATIDRIAQNCHLGKEKLQVYTAYAAAATAFWRYRQYRIRKPEKTAWDRHLEMKALADQALASPVEDFMELMG